MYYPSSYYFGRFISQLLLQMFYPVLMVIIFVYSLDINTSTENVGRFFLVAILLNCSQTGMGWACGSISGNFMVANSINLILTLLFMLTSGSLGNAANFPPWINWLTYISPLRYGVEGFFRCLILNVPNEDGLRDRTITQLGFDLLPG